MQVSEAESKAVRGECVIQPVSKGVETVCTSSRNNKPGCQRRECASTGHCKSKLNMQVGNLNIYNRSGSNEKQNVELEFAVNGNNI